MFIANVTDYDNSTDSDNMTLCNCTNNDNNDTNFEGSNTINYNHTMWNVTYLFNISYGIYSN